jgi:hypothetical protein
MYVTYELSEPQAVALLAALKQLKPEQVSALLPETRDNLSMAYHRLNGALVRSLYGPSANQISQVIR